MPAPLPQEFPTARMAGRSSEARRHHTVPLFYLRGFARAEQVGTVQLPGDKRFVQSIRDASVVNRFYSLEGHEDGSDVIEKALSRIEGEVSGVLGKVRSGVWPLDVDDRTALGYYVALQATRVPVHRQTMDYMARQLLRLQVGAGGKVGLRRRMERDGSEVSEEKLDELWETMTRAEGPPVERTAAAFVQQMVNLSAELLKYVIGRPWSLARFERKRLITSDAPVGLIPHPDAEPWRGTGFMTAWGITFPLARDLGLLMGNIEPLLDHDVPVEMVHRGAADVTVPANTKLADFFNNSTVANASEWLFHHPDDGGVIPGDLPDRNPVTIDPSPFTHEFTGEPWFDRPTASDDGLGS